MTTIIYITDNSLPPKVNTLAQWKLLSATNDHRIVSVSQERMDLGWNLCTGNIGRSHLSMYKQMLIGAEWAPSEFVALAEHDCLYTPQHFAWQPPRSDVFYYNSNVWYVQWVNGEYSYENNRKPNSQLICGKDILIQALKEKIWYLENGYRIIRGKAGMCEFGIYPARQTMSYIGEGDGPQYEGEVCMAGAKSFMTEWPNLDIRHGGNFSGRRRAHDKRAFELPYWGRFLDMVQ